jgi:NADH:ubiquinone oxidoreductase subunit 5 (subunit L)/multisubunit Na+/H+ antiporter MnhA subunit
MFERFRERLNKVINFLYVSAFNKIKWYQVLGVIYIILYFMSIYNLLPQWFLDITLPNGSDCNNLINLFLSLNFGYLIYIISFIKLELINFLLNVFNFLIFNDLLNYDLCINNLNLIFEKHGFNDLVFFYILKITEIKINYYVWVNEYLYISFFKYFLLGFNLPLFFYFGLIFIFTTLISLLLLSYYGFYGVFILNLISIIFFWFSSIIYFDTFFIDNISFKINLGKWFVVFLSHPVFFELNIDSISYSFMFLTLTIAVFVYIYAFSYFRYEPNVERFILLINCFVISMICLVTSGNFFVLFLGWELIGLTSFFLINFWSTRISTLKSAFKAFVFNKFSDVALLIAIIMVFFCINDSNIIVFNNKISVFNNFYLNMFDYQISMLEVTSFFFSICAFIKSAQFGFHIWLPDSMEAPVPASALIHSATLVSAGVFLLLKLTPLFECSAYIYYFLPIIGSFTAFIGGLSSAYQSDIKKILAYSTISHCGFLMVCYSTYIPEYTILYLYIHGFFKAAVFLCVGNVIRFSRNYQDFKKMGGFWKYLPFECYSSFICLMNLSGLPFSIGFYIKHLLLIGMYMNYYVLYFILVNVFCAAVFGLFYSYRLFYYVFFDFKKAKKIIYLQANRKNLNSIYYSNTTLASNIAISLLIIVSYAVSIYMFNLFLNKTSLGEGLNIYSIYSAQYEEFNHPILTTINNIGYFNWLLLLVIILIVLSSWRRVLNYYNIINIFSFFILFFIFFYISYVILV